MSQINVNSIKNKSGEGAPNFPNGATAVGIVTATTFDGNITGNQSGGSINATTGSFNNSLQANGGASISGGSGLTASSAKISDLTDNRVVIAGNSGELEDSSNLTFDGSTLAVTGALSASSGSFSGNVSVGGVLTYEDVTNVDSVGIVTARDGIRVTGGVIEAQSGENKIPALYANLAALPSASTYHGMFAHVHTTEKGYFAHAGAWLELVNKDANGVLGFTGALKEQVKITAGKLSANTNIELENGMVHYFTTNETATATPNIRFSGSKTLDSTMAVGETISVTLISATNSASYYYDQLTIDGNAVTENWVGGSAPSNGGSSGVDIYTYNIIKTGSGTFTVIANQTKTS